MVQDPFACHRAIQKKQIWVRLSEYLLRQLDAVVFQFELRSKSVVVIEAIEMVLFHRTSIFYGVDTSEISRYNTCSPDTMVTRRFYLPYPLIWAIDNVTEINGVSRDHLICDGLRAILENRSPIYTKHEPVEVRL